MPTITYADLEVEINSQSDNAYRLALRSPAGQLRAALQLPWTPAELATWRERLAGPQAGVVAAPSNTPPPQEFGAQLFTALFQSDSLSFYDTTQALAQRDGSHVRLRLHLLAAELAVLPWELLYDARRQEYLALARETPIVRIVETAQPAEKLETPTTLRVLGMASAPVDLPAVDVEHERALLSVLDKVDGVDLVWTASATWRDLQATLQKGPWHIFHFVGHGFFDPKRNEGALILTDDQQHADPRTSLEIARLVGDSPALRLVVLSSCDTAQGSESTLYASLAEILARRGIAAVLAMQRPVSQAAAIEFTRSFYAALANGLPVDAACSEARKAMSLTSPDSWEWATPVLFLRNADGKLWKTPAEVQEDEQQAAAEKRLLPGNLSRRTVAIYGLILLLITLVITAFVAYPYAESALFPSRMTHDFNIAVADIGFKDANGGMHQADFGDDISQALFNDLADAYQTADPVINQAVQIWHDSLGRESGKNVRLNYIEGATAEERTKHAAELAARINADMIVYGYLTDATNPESFALEVYYDRQAKAGEINPTWGSQKFGAALAPVAPYAANPGNARLSIREKLQPRVQALFWLTQAFAYQVLDQPDKALQILLDAEKNLTAWKPQDGKEVLYLFIGAAALYTRDYGLALGYLDQALELNPKYVPALLIRAGVNYDRAQLFPFKSRAIPVAMQACISTLNVENADATLDDAIDSTQRALDDLHVAEKLAPTAEWPELQYRVQLMLGQTYRLLGQWRDYQAVQARADATDQRATIFGDALAAFDQAEKNLNAALAGFPADKQPVYHAWTQMALGQVNQLRADVATRMQDTTATLKWLTASLDHYDQCIALKDQTQGNILFQNKVLKCSCIPSRDDVQSVISKTVEMTK